MFRRLVTLAILMIAVPVMAYAGTWTLNTWVKGSGGAITVNGVSQSFIKSSVFKRYTTGSSPTVSFTVPTGYTADYSYTDVDGSSYSTTAAIAGTNFTHTFNAGKTASSTSSLATLYVTFRAI